MLLQRLAVAIIAFAHALAIAGQNQPQRGSLEPLLLPITVRDAPGAFGTTWRTEVWVTLDDGHLPGFVAPFFGDSACDPPCPLPGGPPPGDFVIGFFRTHTNETAGSLVYVDRDIVERVHISTLLRQDAGGSFDLPPTQIPVVRRSQGISGVVHIMNVPTATTARAMLRIYAFDPDMPPTVRVRAFAGPDNQLFYDSTVTLAATQQIYVAQTETGSLSLPIRPPAVQIAVPPPPPSLLATRIRFEISATAPAQPLWAFVSITDNVTQEVTLRLPQ